MTTWQADDVLDAAVQTLINDRCHRAYMHDMRGGLQAIYTSFEVLARSARNGAQNPTQIENASSLAKRAVAHHERALTDIVNQVTRPESAPEVVNMAREVEQAQQFLRNDALSKGVSLRLSASDNVLVLSQRNKLRSVLLGLLAMGIDASAAGAELLVEVSRADPFALLKMRSESAFAAISETEQLPGRAPVALQPQQLVLGFARRWIASKGGRVEVHAPIGVKADLRIYYPLAAT